jgi:hypothetical protein
VVVVGRETGVRPMGHSAGLRGGVGSTFFRSSRIRPTLLDQYKRLPCTGTAHRKCMCDIRGLAREAYMSCVSGFLCRMYIDSNHHDSRI